MHWRNSHYCLLGYKLGHTGIFLFLVFVISIIFSSESVYALMHSASLSTSGNVVLRVVPSAISGVDSTAVGLATVTSSTTCPLGASLSIGSSTPDANLYLNGDSDNNTSDYTIINPVFGSNVLNTNEWGYSLTNNNISGIFNGITHTPAIIKTYSTAISNDIVSINYGVKVEGMAAPGTYTMSTAGEVPGTIVYYLTMNPNCMVVDIVYDGNNADAGTMGAIHADVGEGDTIELKASSFSRAGYGFVGWSTDENAGAKLVDNDNTNNPIVYGPQENMTIPNGFLNLDTDNDGIVKLYAVWIPAEKDGQNQPIYFQNWVGCSNLEMASYDFTTGALDLTKRSVTALTDMRDNQTYAVARLADGNCWMVENLRLEAGSTRGDNEFLAQGYGKNAIYGDFSGLADSESSNFINVNTANSLYYSGLPSGSATVQIERNYSSPYRIPRYNNVNASSGENNVFSYGNYYNWAAAMANTGLFDNPSSEEAKTSLCPNGWRLPRGGDKSREANNEVWALVVDGMNNGIKPNNYGGTDFSYYSGEDEAGPVANKLRAFPNNFVFSGYYSDSAPIGRGSMGYYWTTNAFNYNNAFALDVRRTIVYPGTDFYARHHGFSVRCLMPSNYWSVHFDANTSDSIVGLMLDQKIEVGTEAFLRPNDYRRPMNGTNGYRFVKWNTKADGSGTDYYDEQSVKDLVTIGNTITLYAQWEATSLLRVNFQSNGLTFSDNTTMNAVGYYNGCWNGVVKKYSHTPNIDDDGVQNGDYPNNANLNEVVTIPGATKLWISLTYEGESVNYDWVSFWEGNYPDYTAANNYSSGVKWDGVGSSGGKYGGTTKTTLEGFINGDTVTFAFKSDYSGVGGGYGYYAVIMGYDNDGNVITGQVCGKKVSAGDYKEPILSSHQILLGWSENQNATTPEYTSEGIIIKDLVGNNDETKTLYAIWKNVYIFHFVNTYNENVKTKKVIIGESDVVGFSGLWAYKDYKLMGWDIVPNDGLDDDNSTVVYADNQVITPTSDMIFYTVWRPSYYISYDINGGDEGAMGRHSGIAEGNEVVLFAPNFSRANFGFAGWSFDANADPNDSGAIIYGPNATLVAPVSTTPGETKTLYAIWVPRETNYSLQTFNATAFEGVNPNKKIVALRDERDNATYAVAKLADGNWWMIENLRLNTAGSSNESLSQGFGRSTTYGNYIGLAAAESSNFTSTNTSPNSIYYSGTQSGTASIDIGTNMASFRFPRYNNANTADRSNGSSSNSNIYGYGNYYTWSAAMANTYYYNGSLSVDANGRTSESAGTSICPKGWKLPSGKNNVANKSFGTLSVALGGPAGGVAADENTTPTASEMSKIIRSFPNNFVYAGYYSVSSAAARGYSGYYWASTAHSEGYSYATRFAVNEFKPANVGMGNYNGFSVRCVYDPPLTIGSLTYLQDFSRLSSLNKVNVLNSMTTDAQYQLKDARDNKTYWISKLRDGNVWMTQNLDLDLGVNTLTNNSTTLYHDDTDIGWGNDSSTMSWTPASATINVASDGTFTSIGTDPYTVPRSVNVGNWYYTDQYYSSATSNYLTGNGGNYFSQTPYAGNGMHGHVGNYYTWTAAVASNDTSGITNSTYDNIANSPQNSICPAGWRLPTVTNASPHYSLAGSRNEFARLVYLYNDNNFVTNSSAKLEGAPLYLVRGGNIYSNALHNSGYNSNYWSSTVHDEISARRLYANTTTVSPMSTVERRFGLSVRCVAR